MPNSFSGRCGLRRRSGLLQKAAATLFAEPVAVAPDRDDVTVVEQAVEDGGRYYGVAEHGAPFADGAVRGHQHGAALVATADELEEQVRGIRLERQIAEFVDDQQLGLGVVRQALLEPAFAMRLGELGHQGRGRREQHRVAGHDGFPAERHRQMCLAHARRPQEQHRLAVGDEAPRRDLPDLRLVDRGLGAEVEAGEIADERKARQAEGHVDAALVAAGDLPFAEQRQRLADRQLPPAGFVDQAVELVAQDGQLQTVEQGREMVVGGPSETSSGDGFVFGQGPQQGRKGRWRRHRGGGRRWTGRSAVPDQAGQMRIVDDTAVAALQFGMDGDLPAAMVDADDRRRSP